MTVLLFCEMIKTGSTIVPRFKFCGELPKQTVKNRQEIEFAGPNKPRVRPPVD